MSSERTDNNADRCRALEARAQQDYRAVHGKVLLVHEVYGLDRNNDSAELTLRTPARVRVIETPPEMITRWVDENWLDPIWDLALVEPHPDLEQAGIDSPWMYGTSYSMDGQTGPARFEVESDRPSRLLRMLKRATS